MRSASVAVGVAVLSLSLAGAPAVAAVIPDEDASQVRIDQVDGVAEEGAAEQQAADEKAPGQKDSEQQEPADGEEQAAPGTGGEQPAAEEAVEEGAPAEDEKAALAAEEEPAAGDEAAAEDEAGEDDAQVGNVHIVEDEQFHKGAVQVEFSLDVPDDMREGDTVTLTYPENLLYDGKKEAVIALKDGTVIATGKLTDAGNREITFTFTDAVDKYRDISVTGRFGMIIDDEVQEPTPRDFVFTQNGVEFEDTLTVLPAQSPPLTAVYVRGEWNDPEDRGREQPEAAITWTAHLPEGEWAGQTVTLSPKDATSLMDCSTVEFYTTQVADGVLYHTSVYDENQVEDGTSPSYAEVIDCSPEKLTVQYTEPVEENFVRQIKVQAAVRDTDETADFGADVANSDLQLVDGGAEISPTKWYNFISRNTEGGEGDGDGRDGAVSLEKYSVEEGADKGDFDSAPGKELIAGGEEQIAFRIVNTGNETLTDVELTDATLSGTPLELADCALADLTMQPGDEIVCEGTLSHASPGHYADKATVTAVTERDGIEVSASDSWNGTVPTPPEKPEEPSQPEEPQQPETQGGDLAVTGMDSSALPWALGGAAVLLVAGASAALVAHHRNRALNKR